MTHQQLISMQLTKNPEDKNNYNIQTKIKVLKNQLEEENQNPKEKPTLLQATSLIPRAKARNQNQLPS